MRLLLDHAVTDTLTRLGRPLPRFSGALAGSVAPLPLASAASGHPGASAPAYLPVPFTGRVDSPRAVAGSVPVPLQTFSPPTSSGPASPAAPPAPASWCPDTLCASLSAAVVEPASSREPPARHSSAHVCAPSSPAPAARRASASTAAPSLCRAAAIALLTAAGLPSAARCSEPAPRKAKMLVQTAEHCGLQML